jgi:hypothetical protein
MEGAYRAGIHEKVPGQHNTGIRMKPGATWKILMPDGRVADSGEVLEIEPLAGSC